jgi:hypothetical protein
MPYSYDKDLEQKPPGFQNMYGTMQRMLKYRTRKDTQITFCEVIAAPVLRYGNGNWVLNNPERRKIERANSSF